MAYFETPFGELILGSHKEDLCLCDWRYRKMRKQIDERIREGLQSEYMEAPSSVIERAKKQLGEYFRSQRTSFDLPIRMVGSDFQKEVWEALLHIPFGRTISYSKLATQLGDMKAIRAVAAANGANCLSIIVPCHRVLGSDGSMTGYAGGVLVKKKLLRLENALRQGELDF
jgi:methylated-DNA-[protein]-cysteine S-methyltransferase